MFSSMVLPVVGPESDLDFGSELRDYLKDLCARVMPF